MKKKLTALLVIFAVTALGLTACGSPSTSTSIAQPPAKHCDTTASGAASFTSAVLVQAGQPIADVAAKVIDVTAAHKGRLVVATATATSRSKTMFDTVLRGDGNNNFERTPNLECKENAARAALDSSSKQSLGGKLDVFDALNTLANTLHTTSKSKPVNVVIDSTMLSASSPVDLTNSRLLAKPDAALNTLASKRLLPNCHGWMVSVVTPEGGTTGAALKAFWRSYFQRCAHNSGGLVSWAPSLPQFPNETVVAAADTAQITVRTDGNKKNITVPADALFGAGQFTFISGADVLLNKVLAVLRTTPGRVTVTGYTDVGGGVSPASDVTLGRNRSRAVIAWIEGKGIASSRVAEPQSAGSANPLFAHPTTPQQHASNRRVVLTIEPAG